MTKQPAKDFGKRKPAPPMQEEAPARKRSNQIALLLMGTMAVGGGAYALMPSESCDPTNTMSYEQRQECEKRRSWSSSSSHGYSSGSGDWSRRNSASDSTSPHANFASSSSSSGSSFSGSSSSSSQVSRHGFGSFASHFSGGG